MTYHYKPPTSFPARFPSALHEASLRPTIPILLWSSANPSDLTWEAERFRYYRWCIRQRPEACPDLAQILSLFNVRTSSDGLGLFVTAAESHMSQITLLNPHLEGIVRSARQ